MVCCALFLMAARQWPRQSEMPGRSVQWPMKHAPLYFYFLFCPLAFHFVTSIAGRNACILFPAGLWWHTLKKVLALVPAGLNSLLGAMSGRHSYFLSAPYGGHALPQTPRPVRGRGRARLDSLSGSKFLWYLYFFLDAYASTTHHCLPCRFISGWQWCVVFLSYL